MDNERIAYWERVHNERCLYSWDGDKTCHCRRKECFSKIE